MPLRAALLALVLATAASAQAPITGTVTDAQTGEPLPGANVALLDEAGAVVGGTASNLDGRFALRVASLPARLAVRFVGYETARLTVEAGGVDLEIALQPSEASLGEVTVTPGEDPAIALMRRVIARTRAQREAIGPYAVTAYGRTTIRGAEESVVAVAEAASEAFWAPETGWREVIVAQRETANVSGGDGVPGVAQGLLDLLTADVTLAGHRLVGPTHPDALSVYRFEITGRRSLDGRALAEVSLAPRSRTASAFEGTLLVLEETADVIEADLRPGPSFLFPPPITVSGARYRQQYVPIAADSSLWLPADLRSTLGVGFRLDVLVSADPLTIERAVQLSNYRPGVLAPDSLLDGLSARRAATLDTTRLERPGETVPLTSGEAEAYAAGDSLGSVNEAWQFRGPLAPLLRRAIRDGEAEAEADTSARPLFGLSLRPAYRANPGAGLSVGLGASLRLGPLALEPDALYRTRDGGVSLGAGARLPLWRGSDVAVSAVGAVRDDVGRRASPLTPEMFEGVGGRGGYYERRSGEAGLRATHDDLGTLSTGGFVQMTATGEAEAVFIAETARTFDLDLETPDPDLLLLGDGSITTHSVRLGLGAGTLGAPLGLLSRRAIQGAAEVGTWSGEGTFWSAEAALDVSLPTFARRRALAPSLDVRLAGGVGGGDLPLTRLLSVEGVLGERGVAFSRFGVLRTRTGVAYEGDRYAAAFWEHSFRSIPFELIGLHVLAERGYTVLLHGAHARTWLGADRQERLGQSGYTLSPTDDWHHEVGVSVSGVLGLFRVDLTQRLDTPQTVVGIGVARLF